MNEEVWRSMRRAVLQKRGGFTSVALLVVIAIITLLIGILVPALAKAREQAKRVSIRANFDAAGKGLEMFKTELPNEVQGESYPSSHPRPPRAPAVGAGAPDYSFGDDPTEPGLQRLSGAQWLVRYLFGKDGEGYVPKKSVPRALIDDPSVSDPYYSQHGQNGGGSWYSNFTPPGGTPAPLVRAPIYLPSGTRSLRRLNELHGGPPDENTAPLGDASTEVPSDATTTAQPVLVDSYDRPILYYSADVRY